MNNNHTLRNILLVFAALFLVAGAFSGGLLVGWLIPSRSALEVPVQTTTITPDPNTQNGTPSNLSQLFTPFWESWQYVHEQFVDQPVNDTKLMQGAIRGMLDSLGEKHTGYSTPEEYKQATISLAGSYAGIGAWVDTTGKLLTITKPMPNSPAEAAGLKAGDAIIKIDGKDVTGVDPSTVLQSVLGPAGTTVTLTIQRSDPLVTLDFTITRAIINLPSIESKMLDQKIAYIALTTFGDTTTEDLKSALSTLLAENPKGLILDLRNNPGGYLNTAIEVISQFIPEGVVMIERQSSGEEITYSATPGGLATKIPMVVLVNGGSASASEITAGAIQDFGRGKIIGVTTYGKGSVQNWIPLSNDQGAVRITVAKWFTPKHRQINDVGLTPDIVVEMTAEDINANRDPQLQKAIDILLLGQ
jgi:carboxyl-terminal processing protease